jgi:hypothetical protein
VSFLSKNSTIIHYIILNFKSAKKKSKKKKKLQEKLTPLDQLTWYTKLTESDP